MVAPFDQARSARCCSGDVRRHKGIGCQFVGPEGAAGVEAEPAEPQQRRTEDREGQVVRPKGCRS